MKPRRLHTNDKSSQSIQSGKLWDWLRACVPHQGLIHIAVIWNNVLIILLRKAAQVKKEKKETKIDSFLSKRWAEVFQNHFFIIFRSWSLINNGPGTWTQLIQLAQQNHPVEGTGLCKRTSFCPGTYSLNCTITSWYSWWITFWKVLRCLRMQRATSWESHKYLGKFNPYTSWDFSLLKCFWNPTR